MRRQVARGLLGVVAFVFVSAGAFLLSLWLMNSW